MNISATNCTPIKPEASFKGNFYETSSDYDRVLRVTNQLNDEFVESDDIKKPFAAAASIGLAGLLAFASGKKLASIFTTYAKKAPVAMEGLLKQGSKSAQDFATSLINENPDKLSKVKNVAGKAIGQVEKLARNGYKKLVYSGIPESANVQERATKAFQNAAGWVGLATVFPAICGRDANDDGVSDILQKGQNAYTGTKTKFGKAFEETSKIAELAEIFM